MSTVVSELNKIVAGYPLSPALVSDAQSVSYRELAALVANAVDAIDRRYLLVRGRYPGPGDLIGLSMDKSIDLYIALLAIVTTGAGYVPIDPSLSNEEMLHIARTTNCGLIFSTEKYRTHHAPIDVLTSEECRSSLKVGGPSLPSRCAQSEACYTIFTSGSSGRPKGVRVSHGNLLNLVRWAIHEFSLCPDSRVLQYSTASFDASVLDIFPTLLAGGCLCVPSQDQRLSDIELARFCARHGIDHAFLPSSLLAALNPGTFPGLRTVLTGGDVCSAPVAQMWSEGRRLYNLYGPTECTVLVASKLMTSPVDTSNIGKPIPGVRLHVLDEHMNRSEQGELFVAGAAVSLGYIGASPEDHARFVRNERVDRDVLYRTGDLVRVLPSGDLRFLGRVDRQVKIRGYRVELEEVERQLIRAGCRSAAVVFGPAKVLEAFVVMDQDSSLELVGENLRSYLPSYKFPEKIVAMSELPVKTSGKVDYSALISRATQNTEAGGSSHCAQDSVERIKAIWSNALDVPVGDICPSSNFIRLGGTSLKTMSLLKSVRECFDIHIPFNDFFNNPTVEYIVRRIEDAKGTAAC